MKKRVLEVILISVMLLTILSGCSVGSTKKVGTAPDGNEMKIEAAALKLINAKTEGGYELVGTEDLKKWIDEGKDMIIIDTMPRDFYSKGHVPGALNAELPKTSINDATPEQKEMFSKLLGHDKDKIIIVYCGFTACGRSHSGAYYAKELGYKNVYRYPGGIIGWQDAGYSTEK